MSGIADAVALAAARGPGGLPPGIANAVLRLAFGRGAAGLAAQDAMSAASRRVGPVVQRGLRLRISHQDRRGGVPNAPRSR